MKENSCKDSDNENHDQKMKYYMTVKINRTR